MVKVKIENESKEQKFKRIASSRANRILEDMRLLGNCSNKSSYGYSNNDIRKIFGAIDAELRRTKLMFEHNRKRKIEL